jgi:hypothetical protein
MTTTDTSTLTGTPGTWGTWSIDPVHSEASPSGT